MLVHSDFNHHLQRNVVRSKSDFANANEFQITDDIMPFFGTSSSLLVAMLFVDHYPPPLCTAGGGLSGSQAGHTPPPKRTVCVGLEAFPPHSTRLP